MAPVRIRRRVGHAAALLAVALLSLATARSLVMQTLAGPWQGLSPICSAQTGAGAHAPGPAKSAHAVCSFCAAAANPPLASGAARIETPSVVLWRPAAAVRVASIRRSPCRRPNARAPPASSQRT